MKVIWSLKAQQSFIEIADYIFEFFGDNAKDNFRDEIFAVTKQLEKMPNLGKAEPLLISNPKSYRSIVINKHSKMVYFIENESVYIADIWETRKEPLNQANQIDA